LSAAHRSADQQLYACRRERLQIVEEPCRVLQQLQLPCCRLLARSCLVVPADKPSAAVAASAPSSAVRMLRPSWPPDEVVCDWLPAAATQGVDADPAGAPLIGGGDAVGRRSPRAAGQASSDMGAASSAGRKEGRRHGRPPAWLRVGPMTVQPAAAPATTAGVSAGVSVVLSATVRRRTSSNQV